MTSVAHVTTIGESLEILLLDQLRAIRDAGYDVTGVSAPGEAVAAIERGGIRHVAVPFVRSSQLTPLADAGVLLAMARTFRRERFDIVHTHTAKADLYAAIAARLAGVRIVVTTLHGFLFHDLTPPKQRRFYAQLAKLGMRFADLVLSQNPEDVDTAVRERLCPPEKIEVLGNGIDIEHFDRARVPAADVERARAELGLKPCELVVGFVGRLVEEKGVRDLFDAMRLVRRTYPEVRLLCVGWYDRAKADAIKPETAREYELDNAVFTGHRRDLPVLYALMDLFVLPSHREGFPRTPMEASAMGLPVVATRIRGCRTAVADGQSGLLVPVRDPAALGEAISQLVRDPARRRQMGERGRKLAEIEFDQRRVFQRVLSAYDRLLTAKGAKAYRRAS